MVICSCSYSTVFEYLCMRMQLFYMHFNYINVLVCILISEHLTLHSTVTVRS